MNQSFSNPQDWSSLYSTPSSVPAHGTFHGQQNMSNNKSGDSSAPQGQLINSGYGYSSSNKLLSAPDQGRVTKPARRRTRASRKTPTTLLSTDPTNFRAMVQQFTGGPFGSGMGVGLAGINNNATTSSSASLQHQILANSNTLNSSAYNMNSFLQQQQFLASSLTGRGYNGASKDGVECNNRSSASENRVGDKYGYNF